MVSRIDKLKTGVIRYDRMVVFDNDLSPSQIRALEDITGATVLDRSALILDIFAQRAQTREGRLQVELAQYQYLLPRLSGMAEEGLLRLVFREPALLDQAKLLKEQFSSELLGRFFEAARTRREAGQAVSPAALEGEFTQEEMAHLTSVLTKDDAVVSEDALADYLRIIREEYDRTHRSGEDALRAMAERMKEKKGYGG